MRAYKATRKQRTEKPNKHLRRPGQDVTSTFRLNIRKICLSTRKIDRLIFGIRMDLLLGVLEMFLSVGSGLWYGFWFLMALPDMCSLLKNKYASTKTLHPPGQVVINTLRLKIRKIFLNVRKIEWLMLEIRMDFLIGVLEMFLGVGSGLWLGFWFLMVLPDMVEAYLFPSLYRDVYAGSGHRESSNQHRPTCVCAGQRESDAPNKPTNITKTYSDQDKKLRIPSESISARHFSA